MASHTLCLSCRFVNMTIEEDRCSHTILQKSSKVGGTGPIRQMAMSKIILLIAVELSRRGGGTGSDNPRNF